MNDNQKRDRANRALSIAQEFAPNGKVQQAFTAIYNKMQADGNSSWDEIAAVMFATVMDGLRFGNWPEA